MSTSARVINKVVEREITHDGRVNFKTVGYVILLKLGDYTTTNYVKKEDMIGLIINHHRENKIEGLDVLKNTNDEYVLVETRDIKEEGHFIYSLTRVMNINRREILGWQLKVTENPIDNKFKCPSMYEGYPVISLARAFENKEYHNTKALNFKEIDMTGMDVSNIISTEDMFYSKNNIHKIDMRGLKFERLLKPDRMFSGCKYLKHLDIRDFIMNDNMIKGLLSSPKKLTVINVLYIDRDLKADYNLSKGHGVIHNTSNAYFGNIPMPDDSAGLAGLDKLIINNDTYEKLRKFNYRIVNSPEELNSIINKCRVMGVDVPNCIRAEII